MAVTESTGGRPILFGGMPKTPAAEVFENARRKNPLEFQLLERAYLEFAQRPENRGTYADPEGSGATLAQIWRVFALFGVAPWCVLARSMPPDQTEGIERLGETKPSELVARLKELQVLAGELNVTALHYDGATGHCIRLTSYDEARDRFIYHDPWPEKSLLSLENNLAGVDAQPEGTRFSVTAAELELVLFAVFLFPNQQALLDGIAFERRLDEWQTSDFFRFFRLKLVDERSANGKRRHLFHAGPFRGLVSVIVDSRDNRKITGATLHIAKRWMVDNLPFAVDIAKSFVREFAPAPDAKIYEEIAETFHDLQRAPSLMPALKKMKATGERPDGLSASAAEMALAFLSGIPRARVGSDLGSLTLESVSEGGAVLELAFVLY